MGCTELAFLVCACLLAHAPSAVAQSSLTLEERVRRLEIQNARQQADIDELTAMVAALDGQVAMLTRGDLAALDASR